MISYYYYSSIAGRNPTNQFSTLCRSRLDKSFKMSSTSSKRSKFSQSAGDIPKKQICGHCDRSLSKSQFLRHKREFFNYATKTWKRSNEQNDAAGSKYVLKGQEQPTITLYKCFHCGKHLARTQYNEHKQNFFNTSTMTWITEDEQSAAVSSSSFVEDVPGSSSDGKLVGYI